LVKPRKIAIRNNVFAQVTALNRWWRGNLIDKRLLEPVQ